jgi:hypothetical protein
MCAPAFGNVATQAPDQANIGSGVDTKRSVTVVVPELLPPAIPIMNGRVDNGGTRGELLRFCAGNAVVLVIRDRLRPTCA